MSRGFNMARVEIYAKANGISFNEACSRLAKRARRRRGGRPIVHNAATPKPRPELWYLRD